MNNPDTDCYSDYDEIRAGSDPLDENSVPGPGDIDLDGDCDGHDLALFIQQLTGVTNQISIGDFADGFAEQAAS